LIRIIFLFVEIISEHFFL